MNEQYWFGVSGTQIDAVYTQLSTIIITDAGVRRREIKIQQILELAVRCVQYFNHHLQPRITQPAVRS